MRRITSPAFDTRVEATSRVGRVRLSTVPVAEASETATVDGYQPSYALWIPLAWFFIVSTRALSTWFGVTHDRGTADADVAAGSPLDRLVLTILIAVGCAILVKRRKALRLILSCNKWVIALLVLIFLSAAWSYFPGISIRRAVRCAGTLIMVLVVLTEKEPLGGTMVLLRRCYIPHLLLSLIAIKYFRDIGVSWSYDGTQQEWTGLAMHKNNLGQVVMSSTLFFAWRFLRGGTGAISRAGDLFFLMLSLYLLRGSGTAQSTTSIIACGSGLCVLLALRYLKKNIEQVMRYAIGFGVVMAMLLGFGYLAMDPGGDEPVDAALGAAGRDPTLTGRTGLWADLLANAAKHPFVGVGYGSFWVGPPGYDLFPLPNWTKATPAWRPLQGHNGFLDVYVELGAIGVTLLILIIGSALRNTQRMLRTNFDAGTLRLTLLVAILVNNITESSFLRGTHSLWFLFLLVGSSVIVTRRGTDRPVLQHSYVAPQLRYGRPTRAVGLTSHAR